MCIVQLYTVIKDIKNTNLKVYKVFNKAIYRKYFKSIYNIEYIRYSKSFKGKKIKTKSNSNSKV